MSERKVLNKYYPPDYDPSKIPRAKKKTKQNDVRIMAPFNMKCTPCGNYIARGTKFNAKKETVEDRSYNDLLIHRIYIKCPRCMGTIILRTNPKEVDYDVEYGATENFMALKMAERQAREEAEAEEEEEKINPMKHLENRTAASKRQMEASEQIQNLKFMKNRYNSVDIESFIKNRDQQAVKSEQVAGSSQKDDAIKEEAKELLKKRALESSDSDLLVIPKLKTAKPANKSKVLDNLRKKVKIRPKEIDAK